MNDLKLSYRQPAREWSETLPLGNGSLGGMVFGSVKQEKIGLNEESIWSGYYRDTLNRDAINHLEECRRLIFEGEYLAANELIGKTMLGGLNENYNPLGDLYIDFAHGDEYSEYRRELSLDDAVATVKYTCGGVQYEREYFTSFPQRAMYIHLTSGEKSSFTLYLQTAMPVTSEAKPDELEYSLRCFEHTDPHYIHSNPDPIIVGMRGKRFTVRLRVLRTDGTLEIQDGKLTINDAADTVIALSAVHHERELPDHDEALARHLADYRRLFGSVELYLGEQSEEPTDVRLQNFREGKEDLGLYTLLFQYGRYLLIACSREGGVPANLQGIWCWDLRPLCSCNWTTNINLQMNYWHAQTTGLSECFEPYLSLMRRLRKTGAEAARIHFGCRGMSVAHNVDIHGQAHPVGVPYGQTEIEDPGLPGCASFVTAGIWMCQDLWRQYEYNPDPEFLKNDVFPFLRDNVLFAIDWLVPWGDYYVTNPSTSPENRFLTPKEHAVTAIAMASTFDMELIRELFGNFKKACELLDIDDECLKDIERIEPKLYPYHIGKYGQLQEWFKDFDEADPGNAHYSPLYGLFPGELFEDHPELKPACRVTLDRRVQHGGLVSATGWSGAWALCFYAIFGESEIVGDRLKYFVQNSLFDNMWAGNFGGGDWKPFQIDANFGITAAMVNMLVQDRAGHIKLLPALPPAWKNGYVRGLCLKGGKKVDMVWENGKLISSRIYSENEQSVQ